MGSKRGDNQIRTGDDGVADRSLTTWLCRRIHLLQNFFCNNVYIIAMELNFVKYFFNTSIKNFTLINYILFKNFNSRLLLYMKLRILFVLIALKICCPISVPLIAVSIIHTTQIISIPSARPTSPPRDLLTP